MSIVFLPKGSPSHTAKSRPGARPSSSSSQADRVYHVGPQGIPEEFSYKLLHGYPARSSHDWFPAIYHDFSWCFLWFSIDFGDLPAMMTSQVWKHHQKHQDDPPTSTMLASTKRSSKHQGKHCPSHPHAATTTKNNSELPHWKQPGNPIRILQRPLPLCCGLPGAGRKFFYMQCFPSCQNHEKRPSMLHNGVTSCIFGGFLKWGYPQVIQSSRMTM